MRVRTTRFHSTLLVLALLALQTGCSEEKKSVTSLADLNGIAIGAMTGTTGEELAKTHFPQATTKSFDDIMDAIAALKSNQIEAVITGFPTALNVCKHNPDLYFLAEPVEYENSCAAVTKSNPQLLARINGVIAGLADDGTLKQMRHRWFKTDLTPYETVQIDLPQQGELLRVGTSATREPFCFIDSMRQVTGHDGELARRIAAALGRPIQFIDMKFSALIPALQSGKIDVIISGMTATTERAKTVNFSRDYFKSAQVILARRPAGHSPRAEDATAMLEALAARESTDANPENPANPAIPEKPANPAPAALAMTPSAVPGAKTMLRTVDDLADKRIGVYAGSVHDIYAQKHYPEAELHHYNTVADMVLALQTEKIDAAFFDKAASLVMMRSNPDIGILTDDVLTLPVGYGFSKSNPALRQQFNDWLKGIKSDGTFDRIYQRWFIDDPVQAQMPKIDFDPAGKPLTLGVAVGDLPNSAIVNGEHIGMDIELLKSFAKSEGYNMKLVTMEFSSLVAALASGKVDIIADGIFITEERQKQVDFCDPYNYMATVVLALQKNIAALAAASAGVTSGVNPPASRPSFFQGIARSFHSNIILENRYLLILDGLKVTIIISILSVLFGTVLGGVICFLRMSRNRLANGFARLYISILRGTPVLVLLMIIFYVVFASVDIDPVIVAVVAFGLNFAAYVSEMFRTGIESIDCGQSEAGIALGFTKVKTFVYIIAPQAIRRILPVFKGEVISLVKMTSIVGYIAVQDLTKASDIIRSRTFDAFFPLIMVAVLYFMISWLLLLTLEYVERLTDPKTKAKRA